VTDRRCGSEEEAKAEADRREIARTTLCPEEREVANERINSMMHAIGK
jgi:hypothetical protein